MIGNGFFLSNTFSGALVYLGLLSFFMILVFGFRGGDDDD